MEPIQKITIREMPDLGPVLARADHQQNAIEVNARAFYQLPPMVQEFVLCHEVCHLRHNEWDEARTNQLAALLFMRRAQDEADREARRRFLAYMDGHGNYSNELATIIIAAVSAAFSIGMTIYSVASARNAAWYSWDKATQRQALDTTLTYAFEQARRSGSHSAKEFFWSQFAGYTAKDDSANEFLERKANAWVGNVIKTYENRYGFKFDEVTPVDLTAFPGVIVAIGAVVALVAYLIIKKTKK